MSRLIDRCLPQPYIRHSWPEDRASPSPAAERGARFPARAVAAVAADVVAATDVLDGVEVRLVSSENAALASVLDSAGLHLQPGALASPGQRTSVRTLD
jgi:hypothetical protein